MAFSETFAAALKSCKLVSLGEGVHHLQEDHPDAIGEAVCDFIARCETKLLPRGA